MGSTQLGSTSMGATVRRLEANEGRGRSNSPFLAGRRNHAVEHMDLESGEKKNVMRGCLHSGCWQVQVLLRSWCTPRGGSAAPELSFEESSQPAVQQLTFTERLENVRGDLVAGAKKLGRPTVKDFLTPRHLPLVIGIAIELAWGLTVFQGQDSYFFVGPIQDGSTLNFFVSAYMGAALLLAYLYRGALVKTRDVARQAEEDARKIGHWSDERAEEKAKAVSWAQIIQYFLFYAYAIEVSAH